MARRGEAVDYLEFPLTQASSDWGDGEGEAPEAAWAGGRGRRWPQNPLGTWAETAAVWRIRSGSGKAVGKMARTRRRRRRPGSVAGDDPRSRRGWPAGRRRDR